MTFRTWASTWQTNSRKCGLPAVANPALASRLTNNRLEFAIATSNVRIANLVTLPRHNGFATAGEAVNEGPKGQNRHLVGAQRASNPGYLTDSELAGEQTRRKP